MSSDLPRTGNEILGMPPSQLMEMCIIFATVVFAAVVMARFINEEHREEVAHQKKMRQDQLEHEEWLWQRQLQREALRLSSEKRRPTK